MPRIIDGDWNSFLSHMNPLLLRDFQEGRASLGVRTAVEKQPMLI